MALPKLDTVASSEVYLDLDEHIKPFLDIGASDSSQDKILNLLNATSAAQLNDILDVSTLAKHTVTAERFDGGTDKVYCRDFPVLSVSSIVQGSTETVWSQDPEYLFEKNMVKTYGVIGGGLNYEQSKITYVAGYVTLHQTLEGGGYEDEAVTFPDNLLQANLMLLAGMYNKRKGEGVKSYTLQGRSVTFRDDAEQGDFERILNTYRKVRVWSV